MTERPSRVLFVNACILRKTSRTYRLAQALIDRLGAPEVEEIVLENEDLRPLDSATLTKRNELISAGSFSDPSFRFSRQLMEYDCVVMASPYYECMFNALLKNYLENVSIANLIFRYNEEGIPVGRCRGTLYYVTTRGGYDTDETDAGVKVIDNVRRMFGFDELKVVSASGLDVVGNDPEAIVDDVISRLPEMI